MWIFTLNCFQVTLVSFAGIHSASLLHQRFFKCTFPPAIYENTQLRVHHYYHFAVIADEDHYYLIIILI